MTQNADESTFDTARPGAPRAVEERGRHRPGLLEAAPDAVTVEAADGTILAINPAGVALLQAASAADVVGRSIIDFVDPSQHQLVREHLAAVFRGETQDATLEVSGVEGNRRWVWRHVAPMRGPDARVESALSIGRDVTAMRKGESDHRRLRLRMATALEDERRRIARELHNSLSQHLTALVLDLHALRYAGRDQHDIGSRLLRLQEVADRIAREAHRVTMELRPLALDDLGLKSAMRGLVEQWSEQHDVMPHTRLMGLESPRLPPVVETTVYRLVHEGLANVGKHAQATDVGIIVERRGDEVVVILEDDGRGFDVEATMGQPPTGHLGLSGMRDRVELCDGTLTIESMSGEGTTLIARIPLTGPEA